MQLTSLSNFRKEKLIFTYSPVKNTKFNFERIKIETKYPNNKKGPLVIETPFLFSFGVTERRSQDESNELVGYSIPVCLWSKDEQPTPEENEFYKCLTNIQKFCYEHLKDVFDVDLYDKLNDLLYYKQIECTDKYGKKYKKRDKTRPPVLYAKLIYSEKSDKILTLFRTKGNEKPEPLDYLNQYYKVKLALIIESIYVGENAVSIQVKVHEAYVKSLHLNRESLLSIQESEDED